MTTFSSGKVRTPSSSLSKSMNTSLNSATCSSVNCHSDWNHDAMCKHEVSILAQIWIAHMSPALKKSRWVHVQVRTEPEKIARTWFGEISSCCFLTIQLSPTCVLLNYVFQTIFWPCTSIFVRFWIPSAYVSPPPSRTRFASRCCTESTQPPSQHVSCDFRLPPSRG